MEDDECGAKKTVLELVVLLASILHIMIDVVGYMPPLHSILSTLSHFIFAITTIITAGTVVLQ